MVNPNVLGLHAAVVEQPITETLETNYMPYAMSVIVSRRRSRRSTASNLLTASFCIPCIKWACSTAAGPKAPILWARPCA